MDLRLSIVVVTRYVLISEFYVIVVYFFNFFVSVLEVTSFETNSSTLVHVKRGWVLSRA